MQLDEDNAQVGVEWVEVGGGGGGSPQTPASELPPPASALPQLAEVVAPAVDPRVTWEAEMTALGFCFSRPARDRSNADDDVWLRRPCIEKVHGSANLGRVLDVRSLAKKLAEGGRSLGPRVASFNINDNTTWIRLTLRRPDRCEVKVTASGFMTIVAPSEASVWYGLRAVQRLLARRTPKALRRGRAMHNVRIHYVEGSARARDRIGLSGFAAIAEAREDFATHYEPELDELAQRVECLPVEDAKRDSQERDHVFVRVYATGRVVCQQTSRTKFDENMQAMREIVGQHAASVKEAEARVKKEERVRRLYG